jgi:hypothetical protein
VCVARQKGIDRPHHQFAEAKNIRGAVQVGRSISPVTKELEQVEHQQKKKKRGERTVGEKLFPLFLIKEEATRHTTEKKKKRAAEKKEMGERLVSPFFFSIHQLPLFLIEQLCVEG